MLVKLHQGQYEVAMDRHRYKIVCAGRRWGKSTLSRMSLLQKAVSAKGYYWIVNPYYRQAKMIHWQELLKEVPKGWIKRTNEAELSMELKNGSFIQLKGAENPDALRGVALKYLVIDEIASIKNWEWLWREVLRPTLTDYQAPAMFISTPKGFNHFYDLFMLGQRKRGEYKSWRFTSFENPYIKREEIEKARKDLSAELFAQEYLADFRKFTGLIYKDFSEEVNIVDPFPIPEGWRIYRGFDYGFTNPTAWIWIAVDEDENWFVFDEYYMPQKTTKYFASLLHAHPLDGRVIASYGDPSAAGPIEEYRQYRVFITPANKEMGTRQSTWVRQGIDKVTEKLKRIPGKVTKAVHRDRALEDGEPSLYVFRNCRNIIREFNTYRWREKAVTAASDLNSPDVPEKANDHALDALRYFAVSYKKEEYFTDFRDHRDWRIGS